MTMHQERAAAVRQLVDQARAIEKSGVTAANLEKIGGLLASLATPRRSVSRRTSSRSGPTAASIA